MWYNKNLFWNYKRKNIKEANYLYIIVGLGNPGDKYAKTRHNVGFNVIDLLAKEYSIDVSKIKHKALTGEGRVGTEKVILVKPIILIL